MPNDGDLGLFKKFHVERVDGANRPGRKHCGCEYFPLDLTHDPHAIPAILAYASSCEEESPALADDLRQKAERMQLEFGVPTPMHPYEELLVQARNAVARLSDGRRDLQGRRGRELVVEIDQAFGSGVT